MGLGIKDVIYTIVNNFGTPQVLSVKSFSSFGYNSVWNKTTRRNCTYRPGIYIAIYAHVVALGGQDLEIERDDIGNRLLFIRSKVRRDSGGKVRK